MDLIIRETTIVKIVQLAMTLKIKYFKSEREK